MFKIFDGSEKAPPQNEHLSTPLIMNVGPPKRGGSHLLDQETCNVCVCTAPGGFFERQVKVVAAGAV